MESLTEMVENDETILLSFRFYLYQSSLLLVKECMCVHTFQTNEI